jgi:D-alanyl-D-alanine carboxypeptidase
MASAVLAGLLLCVCFHAAPASARSEQKRHVPAHLAARQVPALASTALGPTAPGVSAILIDARSGSVISGAGEDIPRYPASLTKLMTLDLAFQALNAGRMTLDTVLPVSAHAAAAEPVKLGLRPGSSITVGQAILAMTTMSANDAATALGEYLGGGSELRCGQMMTLRAHALGMAQTQFTNASGLPDPNQVSTARDLAMLARDIVVSYPQFQSFFEVQKFDLDGHIIYSNNQMLKTYPGATGMKTGYTILARHNLITTADRNGKTLIGVVLHEPSWGQTYGQMTAMLDSGFGAGGPAGTMIASNQPPVAPPLPARSGPSLFPEADAATIRPMKKPPAAQGNTTGWVAQVGAYSRMSKARAQAIAVQQMRGEGVPRVAKVQSHGKTLWTAQLAGLTERGASATCSALAAKGDSCKIIGPQAEHWAARDSSTDS